MGSFRRFQRAELVALGVAALVAIGFLIGMLLTRADPRPDGDEAPRSRVSGRVKDRAAQLQAAAAASDPAIGREHRRARRLADTALGHRDPTWRVLAALERGRYLLENGAGYCFEVRTGYWPEFSPSAVKPAGRFAAAQVPGIGC